MRHSGAMGVGNTRTPSTRRAKASGVSPGLGPRLAYCSRRCTAAPYTKIFSRSVGLREATRTGMRSAMRAHSAASAKRAISSAQGKGVGSSGGISGGVSSG